MTCFKHIPIIYRTILKSSHSLDVPQSSCRNGLRNQREACGIAFEKEDHALAEEIDETIRNLGLQEKEGSLWYFEHALVPALELVKTSKDHSKAVEHLEAMTSPSRLLPQFREELKYWKKEIATGQSRG
jgi:hypothetical protein